MKTLTQFIVYMVKWILAPVTITYIYLHDMVKWDTLPAFLAANVFWGARDHEQKEVNNSPESKR